MGGIVLYLIGAFFVIGGIDYVAGNPLNLGQKFEEGIKAMGAVGLGMIGIYSLSPVISQVLSKAVIPVSRLFNVDPSAFAASFLAVDMGGYQIARDLALNEKTGLFSGIIVASNLGAAISFSIPVAIGIISKDEQKFFSNGVMVGIVSIPFGCFVAGLSYGLSTFYLLKNMLPVLVISAIVGMGLWLMPKILFRCFDIFGRMIIGLSIVGLLVQGGRSVFGFDLGLKIVSMKEVMAVVGKIAFVLAGAYPMLAVLDRLFSSFLRKIGNRYGINGASIMGLVGNLATNLLMFGNFKDMNPKGKVICSAFAISGAFVFGGQMGFVSGVAPDMLMPFIISKFAAGILSIFLASWMWERWKI